MTLLVLYRPKLAIARIDQWHHLLEPLAKLRQGKLGLFRSLERSKILKGEFGNYCEKGAAGICQHAELLPS